MSRKLTCLAAILAVLAGLALAVDLPIAAWFAQSHLPGELAKLVTLSEAFSHGWGVACMVLTVLVLDRANRRRVVRVVASAYGAGLWANLMKILVARWRPGTQPFQSIGETFAGWLPCATQDWHCLVQREIQSFPSSHVATATGLAVALSWLYPQGRWLFAFFVLLAAVQRMHCSAHFLSDTLAGAALACLWTACCLRPAFWGRRFEHWEAAAR